MVSICVNEPASKLRQLRGRHAACSAASAALSSAVEAEELGRETANIPAFSSAKWRLLEQVPCSELLVSHSITDFTAEHGSDGGKLLPSTP